MKILKNIMLVFLGALIFTACDDDDKIVYNSEDAIAPTLTSPASSSELTFTSDNASDTIAFSWSAADPGVSVEVDYTVEVSTTESFDDATTIVSETTDLEEDVTVSTLNNALVSMEMDVDTEATVYFRVVASISDYTDDLTSATASFEVTPYETVIDYPMIYVPGAYQGWTPGDDDGILYSYESNTVYEGIIRISADDDPSEFKITSEASWDGTNWGGTLTADGDDYSGTLDTDGGNFSVTNATYAFTVDTDALTISMVKTDDWGLVGDATGDSSWGTDLDMSYNGQMQRWEITTDLVAGECKFRANDAWTLNYGITDDDDGTLESSGDNITISEDGNYTITLDTENLVYTLTAN
jgi:hypothetical protein